VKSSLCNGVAPIFLKTLTIILASHTSRIQSNLLSEATHTLGSITTPIVLTPFENVILKHYLRTFGPCAADFFTNEASYLYQFEPFEVRRAAIIRVTEGYPVHS
jgi:hypothetical protein